METLHAGAELNVVGVAASIRATETIYGTLISGTSGHDAPSIVVKQSIVLYFSILDSEKTKDPIQELIAHIQTRTIILNGDCIGHPV